MKKLCCSDRCQEQLQGSGCTLLLTPHPAWGSPEWRSPVREAAGMAPLEAPFQRWSCNAHLAALKAMSTPGALGVMPKMCCSDTAIDSCSLLSAVVSADFYVHLLFSIHYDSSCSCSPCEQHLPNVSILSCTSPGLWAECAEGESMHLQSCMTLAGLRSSVVSEPICLCWTLPCGMQSCRALSTRD